VSVGTRAKIAGKNVRQTCKRNNINNKLEKHTPPKRFKILMNLRLLSLMLNSPQFS
jgi:hypothetical protein